MHGLGLGEAKLAAFYTDPVKLACDRRSAQKAYELRSFSSDPAIQWSAMRLAKFGAHWVKGLSGRLVAQPAKPAY